MVKSLLFYLFTFFIFSTNIFSQNIVSFSYLLNKKSSSNLYDYSRANDLITNLHPKVYLINGEEKSTSKSSVYFCETDVKSYNSIFDRANLSSIEIITIKITKNDQPNFDLKLLKSKFSKLKFVYLIYEYPTNESAILKQISNNDNQLLAIYNISIPN